MEVMVILVFVAVVVVIVEVVMVAVEVMEVVVEVVIVVVVEVLVVEVVVVLAVVMVVASKIIMLLSFYCQLTKVLEVTQEERIPTAELPTSYCSKATSVRDCFDDDCHGRAQHCTEVGRPGVYSKPLCA